MSLFEELQARAFSEVEAASTLPELLEVEKRWLGRKGIITLALREYGAAKKLERLMDEMFSRLDAYFDRREKELAEAAS